MNTAEFHGEEPTEVDVTQTLRLGPFIIKLEPEDVHGYAQVGVFHEDTPLVWVDTFYDNDEWPEGPALATVYVHMGEDDPEVLHFKEGETA